MMPAETKTPPKSMMSYLWEDIPRDLMERAQTKLRAEIPPAKLKWKLLELLTLWTDGPKRGRPAKVGKRRK